MDDAFFNIPMGMKRVICITPITREMLSSSGIDCLGDDCGYFVYETVEGDPIRAFNILAKVPSLEAAEKLAELLAAAAEWQRAQEEWVVTEKGSQAVLVAA